MAGVNFNLHSQKLNTGGTPSMATPTLLSGNAAGGMRAAQVNTNAANVRHVDAVVPGINPDTTLISAGAFANVLIRSAEDFQDRRDKVTADDLTTRYEESLRRKWAGHQEEGGEFKQGYSSTIGDVANGSYSSVMADADQELKDHLDQVSPAVAKKALLGMYDARATFSSRASQHNAKQLQFAESQARVTRTEQLHREMEVDPERGWSKMRQHAADAPTIQETYKLLGEGMAQATSKIYDENMSSGASEEVAFGSAMAFFEAHREEIPEEAEEAVSSAMRQLGATIQAKQGKKVKESNEALQARWEAYGSTDVAKLLLGGEDGMKGLPGVTAQIMAAWPDDPVKAKSVITTNYQEALRGIMQVRGYEGAKVAWEGAKISATDNDAVIGDMDIMADINKFMEGGLRTEANTMELTARNTSKKSILTGVMKSNSEAELLHYRETIMNSPSATAEDISFVDGAITNRRNTINNTIKTQTKQAQTSNYMQLRSEAKNGATQEYEAKVLKAYQAHEIDDNQVKKLVQRGEDFSAGKVSPGYKGLDSSVKKMVVSEDMIYDPATNEAHFRSMLTPEKIDAIEAQQKLSGRSPEVLQELAASAIMDQAEQWKNAPANKGKTYDQFMPEYYLQHPEVKRGFLNNLARNIINVGLPEKWEVDEGRVVTPRVEYVPPESTGEALDTPGVSGLRKVPQQPGDTSPIAMVNPKRIEEYAVSVIPEKYKGNPVYADKGTDWLLALQMLREYGKPVDTYDKYQMDKAANDILNTVEYQEWKLNRTKGL